MIQSTKDLDFKVKEHILVFDAANNKILIVSNLILKIILFIIIYDLDCNIFVDYRLGQFYSDIFLRSTHSGLVIHTVLTGNTSSDNWNLTAAQVTNCYLQEPVLTSTIALSI